MIPLIAYIATIAGANWLIATVGLVPVGFGLVAPAGVYAAGAALALRDVVQDQMGRRAVIGAILGGAIISVAASPALALASGVAFLASELADMAVYSPLRERRWTLAVFLSGLVGAVIDSALFLQLAGLPLDLIAGQVVGKVWITLLFLTLVSLARRWVPREQA